MGGIERHTKGRSRRRKRVMIPRVGIGGFGTKTCNECSSYNLCESMGHRLEIIQSLFERSRNS